MFGTVVFAGAIALSACGEGNTNEPASNDPEEETEEREQDSGDTEADATEDEVENDDDAEETADSGDWEFAVGDTIENEGGTATLVARQDDIDTYETGPMVLDIPQINVQEREFSEEMLEFMDGDYGTYPNRYGSRKHIG